ncbi:hypothetical protein ETD83_04545 [Actinomadura soli]|uniref:Uncharacterized protein n=1 Tax=Actinomadura soli TaxID=2508997 RepID=A0A5C4JIV0_9ACTN|nr:hypothetical protein ETD83_04545 [Actinomadura soli]
MSEIDERHPVITPRRVRFDWADTPLHRPPRGPPGTRPGKRPGTGPLPEPRRARAPSAAPRRPGPPLRTCREDA